MSDAYITYFPVGNGDTSLIRLTDGSSIIIDCNITEDSRNSSDKTRYDVHAHLLKVLPKDKDKSPYANAFILTHPDQDHCRGFTETFYVGDPSKYSDQHMKDGLIIINELWFTPRIFSPHEGKLCDEANAFRKEAKRRMKLYKEGKAERSHPGNRLRIIGYSDLLEIEGLNSIITVPGNTVNLIDGSKKEDFSFFVHAPFKKDTDSKWGERNDTSLVLQARFDVDNERHAALAIFGGDARLEIWESILELSDEATLKWDLFMAPHHCSWSFFSEEDYKDNQTPSEKALELLRKKREGAIIIGSCKPIKDDDDNPPHYAAAKEYKKVVGAKKFYVTMEHPDEKQPLPLIFRMTKNGPVKDESSEASEVVSSAAIHPSVGTPKTYGN